VIGAGCGGEAPALTAVPLLHPSPTGVSESQGRMPVDPFFTSELSGERVARSPDPLVLEMAGFVDKLAAWKVIAHFTFRDKSVYAACPLRGARGKGRQGRFVGKRGVSLPVAGRAYERFMARCLPGVGYFYAVEANPSRDGHHVHSTWDSSDAPRTATFREWLSRYGRNRIEPVRSFEDVVSYCSKYVTKEGAWWNYVLTPQGMMKARRA
jgi:hypothetical protein